jgi:hypothetical protein
MIFDIWRKNKFSVIVHHYICRILSTRDSKQIIHVRTHMDLTLTQNYQVVHRIKTERQSKTKTNCGSHQLR